MKVNTATPYMKLRVVDGLQAYRGTVAKYKLSRIPLCSTPFTNLLHNLIVLGPLRPRSNNV